MTSPGAVAAVAAVGEAWTGRTLGWVDAQAVEIPWSDPDMSRDGADARVLRHGGDGLTHHLSYRREWDKGGVSPSWTRTFTLALAEGTRVEATVGSGYQLAVSSPYTVIVEGPAPAPDRFARARRALRSRLGEHARWELGPFARQAVDAGASDLAQAILDDPDLQPLSPDLVQLRQALRSAPAALELPPVQTCSDPGSLGDEMDRGKAAAGAIIDDLRRRYMVGEKPEALFVAGVRAIEEAMPAVFGPANAWLFNERGRMIAALGEALELDDDTLDRLADELETLRSSS